VNVTIPLATSHTLAQTLELIMTFFVYPLVAVPGINHCRAVPTYLESGTNFVLIGEHDHPNVMLVIRQVETH